VGARDWFGDGRCLMRDRPYESSALKDLLAGGEVGRYLEPRKRERSAIAAIRGLPSVVEENDGQ